MSEHQLKWDVKQRLTLLEATVYWTGELVTGFLTGTFSISRVQATKDIAMYLSYRPDNLRYDRSLKRYLITEKFNPLLISGKAQECLLVLQASQFKAAPVFTLVNNLPDVSVVLPPTRQIDINVLRPILNSAKYGLVIEIAYQSSAQAAPSVYTVHPQTLVYDGLHWHMRAYSETHDEYRDFLLSRLHCAVVLGKPDQPCPTDTQWEQMVTVEIGLHPGLNEPQRLAVERDFELREGRRSIEMRAALVGYFLQAMRIGNDDYKRDPELQQLVLLNRQALQEYISAPNGFSGALV